jgi:nitrate reductase gamma subunit
MILLLGKMVQSPPGGRTSLVAYLRYLGVPFLLIASLLVILAMACVYALVATISLSVANRQQVFTVFVGGLALVAVVALVVNRRVTRKEAQAHSPLDSTQTTT